MSVFLTMLTLYPDGRLTGFAKATKTSGAAKVCWSGLPNEYFERFKNSEFFCRHNNYKHIAI